MGHNINKCNKNLFVVRALRNNDDERSAAKQGEDTDMQTDVQYKSKRYTIITMK